MCADRTKWSRQSRKYNNCVNTEVKKRPNSPFEFPWRYTSHAAAWADQWESNMYRKIKSLMDFLKIWESYFQNYCIVIQVQ